MQALLRRAAAVRAMPRLPERAHYHEERARRKTIRCAGEDDPLCGSVLLGHYPLCRRCVFTPPAAQPPEDVGRGARRAAVSLSGAALPRGAGRII